MNLRLVHRARLRYLFCNVGSSNGGGRKREEEKAKQEVRERREETFILIYLEILNYFTKGLKNMALLLGNSEFF